MHGLLQQLQALTSPDVKLSLRDIEPKISELYAQIRESDDVIATIVETMKNTSQNPIANYYTLLFVFLYVGAYLFQWVESPWASLSSHMNMDLDSCSFLGKFKC